MFIRSTFLKITYWEKKIFSNGCSLKTDKLQQYQGLNFCLFVLFFKGHPGDALVNYRDVQEGTPKTS